MALVFIDFSKAFDSVDREMMFNILALYGIPTAIIDAIKVCVKINDAFYSFVYYFFIIASIFSIFGMTTETVFVHPRKRKNSKNNIFHFPKWGVKILELLKFSYFLEKNHRM